MSTAEIQQLPMSATDAELSAALARYRELDDHVGASRKSRLPLAELAYLERQRLRGAICAALIERRGEYDDGVCLVLLDDIPGWFVAFPHGDPILGPDVVKAPKGAWNNAAAVAQLRRLNRERFAPLKGRAG